MKLSSFRKFNRVLVYPVMNSKVYLSNVGFARSISRAVSFAVTFFNALGIKVGADVWLCLKRDYQNLLGLQNIVWFRCNKWIYIIATRCWNAISQEISRVSSVRCVCHFVCCNASRAVRRRSAVDDVGVVFRSHEQFRCSVPNGDDLVSCEQWLEGFVNDPC